MLWFEAENEAVVAHMSRNATRTRLRLDVKNLKGGLSHLPLQQLDLGLGDRMFDLKLQGDGEHRIPAALYARLRGQRTFVSSNDANAVSDVGSSLQNDSVYITVHSNT